MVIQRRASSFGLKRAVGRLLGAILAIASCGWANAAERNDLREFRIGMSVSELPTDGYGEFACGSDGGEAGAPLDGWGGFGRCEPEASGFHEVRFEYTAPKTEFAKANDKWEGTRVFGHPSLVSLLIDGSGVVRGIRIVTDPKSRPYMRKKAFLLGQRAKYRFSPETWRCVTHEPSHGERPVGGVYFNEVCENRFDDRFIKIEVQLYRTAEQDLSDFVNRTEIEIFGAQDD